MAARFTSTASQKHALQPPALPSSDQRIASRRFFHIEARCLIELPIGLRGARGIEFGGLLAKIDLLFRIQVNLDEERKGPAHASHPYGNIDERIRGHLQMLLTDLASYPMCKLHRDFEALLEEVALMQHLRPRDPVIRLHQVVETEENVGEVFTMGQVPPAERLDVDRPKAFQHTFLRSRKLPPRSPVREDVLHSASAPKQRQVLPDQIVVVRERLSTPQRAWTEAELRELERMDDSSSVQSPQPERTPGDGVRWPCRERCRRSCR